MESVIIIDLHLEALPMIMVVKRNIEEGDLNPTFMDIVPTRSSGMMTCLARDYVGHAQQNMWTRER